MSRLAAAEALAAQVRQAIDGLPQWAQDKPLVQADRADLDAALALLRDALDGMERHEREPLERGGVWCMEHGRALPQCPDYAAWERTATAAEAALARLAALYGVEVPPDKTMYDPPRCSCPGRNWNEHGDNCGVAPASPHPEPSP